jgi:hypothetical protein
MWLYNQSSTTARTALIYITVGALTLIWAGVWFVALFNNPPETTTVYYWCAGFMATGLTLILIGVAVGWFGEPTQLAALPPEGVSIAVVTPQPLATAPAPGLAAQNPNGHLVAPDGQVVAGPPQRG